MKSLARTTFLVLLGILCLGQTPRKGTMAIMNSDSLIIQGNDTANVKIYNDGKCKIDTVAKLPLHINVESYPIGAYLILVFINDEKHFFRTQITR